MSSVFPDARAEIIPPTLQAVYASSLTGGQGDRMVFVPACCATITADRAAHWQCRQHEPDPEAERPKPQAASLSPPPAIRHGPGLYNVTDYNLNAVCAWAVPVPVRATAATRERGEWALTTTTLPVAKGPLARITRSPQAGATQQLLPY
jgi:hypothetical protein